MRGKVDGMVWCVEDGRGGVGIYHDHEREISLDEEN